MQKQKFTQVFLCIFLMVFFAMFLSCEEKVDSSKENQRKNEELMLEANKQLGMPSILNFQEKKFFKMILEMRDKENLVTYLYIVNHITGKLIFIGKGIGYGIPASTQYTNPSKMIGYGEGKRVIPQADPNGLFMPTSSSATWYLLQDEKGKIRPVYIEPEIIVSPFKLQNHLLQKN